MTIYTANKSQSQGRKGWTIVYRHPARKDSKGNGLRVRKGLSTSDPNEADKLVGQMNELLANESFWSLDAKPVAEKIYDNRIVSAFYSSLEVQPRNYLGIRESFLPLSTLNGYKKILLIGTIGAGKTTLLRQLIGSDPERDRFPSTAPGRTTVSDIEVIMADGPYKTIVTFLSEVETRFFVEECVEQAIYLADKGGKDPEIGGILLTDPENRFKLNQILGDVEFENEAIPASEQEESNKFIKHCIQRVKNIADSIRKRLNDPAYPEYFNLKEKDQKKAEELFEKLLYEQDEFSLLVDDLIDEIKKRFEVKEGKFDREDWPEYWEFDTSDRDKFIKTIRIFSSNYAPLRGRLLTPLVQGIRIRGPLYPNWTKEHPKLVLIDGEGLGGSPDSTDSIPTNISRRFDSVDEILLVDNATASMLKSPTTVLKTIWGSGHLSKLAIAFTHFDQVGGDEFETENINKRIIKRQNHVFNALRTGLTVFNKELDRSEILSIEQELRGRCFIFGCMDKKFSSDSDSEDIKFTIKELNRMLETFQSTNVITPKGKTKSKYDDYHLQPVIQNVVVDFHKLWSNYLGYGPIDKAVHWASIKALSRRCAVGIEGHKDLRPVARLKDDMIYKIRLYLKDPVNLEAIELSEQERDVIIAAICTKIYTELQPLAYDRLIKTRLSDWDKAYWYRGSGSTKIRARDIKVIIDTAVPLIGDTSASDFYERIRNIIKSSIESELS